MKPFYFSIALLFLFLAHQSLGQISVKGGRTQGANDGKTFEWGGPTKSTVSVDMDTRKNSQNESVCIFKNVSSNASFDLSNSALGVFNVERPVTFSKHGGKLKDTDGDKPEHFPGWVMLTFSTPVPASEIVITIHDADQRGDPNSGTSGHIWFNKNRSEVATSTGTASNSDFQRLVWDNPYNQTSATYNTTNGKIGWDISKNDDDANKYIAIAGTTAKTVKRIVIEVENIGDDIHFGVGWLSPISTLPVSLISFNANKIDNSNVKLTWKVSETGNDVSHYDVERSTDGTNFTRTTSLNAIGSDQYQTTDNVANLGETVYYRIKMAEINGSFKYTPVLKVSLNGKSEGVRTFPNPATNKLSLVINSETNAPASIALINISGQTVFVKTTAVLKGTNVVEIDNLGSIARGIYYVQVKSPDNSLNESRKVVLQ